MKKILLTNITSIILSSFLWAQQIQIEGKVIEAKTGAPVVGANVAVSGSLNGSYTDYEGNFSFQSPTQLPITLSVTSVGYEEQVIEIDEVSTVKIELHHKDQLMDEVVFLASRVEENILKSPVTIEKLSAAKIRSSASLSYYDALRNLKGVDMVTSSLTFKQINTRGFNDISNSRFLQLTDGMDNQTPGLNFSVGNLFGSSDIDVESVEIIPGSTSALYGPVAFNGVLMINTKNPFDYQGLTVEMKTGVNHINDQFSDPQGLYNLSVRYAKAFNNRFAFKINASYLSGEDWYATNYTDVDEQTPPEMRGDDNPARDALNNYGDEVVIALPGIGRVSRTGYAEKDLMEYNVHSLKISGSMNYRINNQTALSYQVNYGNGTAPYTGSNRFCLNNFTLQQHKIDLQNRNYFIRAYAVKENSHDSYNARALGQLINRSWVRDLNGNIVNPDQADQMWFTRYQEAYNGNVETIEANNHYAARSFANEGRYLPGSEPFEEEKERLIGIDGLSGAGIFSQSKFYHAEGQYDFSEHIRWFDLQVGGNLRYYDMFTNGTLFDDLEEKVTVKEGGAFIQLSRHFFNNRLKVVFSDRYDKNQNFKGRMTPRAAMVYSPKDNHNIRLSYQSGFRNPTIGDQYIKLNAGVITILGGVPDNSMDLNVYQNSFEIASVDAFGGAFGAAVGNGTPPGQAVMENKDLLIKSDVAYIKPEQVKTFEIGYRTLLGNKLVIDANYHYSTYKDFILNTVVMEPESPVLGNDGSINPDAAWDILNGNIHLYQLYTNASDEVSAQGVTIGLTFLLQKGYSISANGTWADFDIKYANPNNIPPFNTPEYRTNFMIDKSPGNDRFGFNVAWRWQDAFDWVGTFNELRPGRIEAYSIFDAQASYKLPIMRSMVKLGASSLFNNRIYQAYGSPSIGGVYYFSILFDQSLR